MDTGRRSSVEHERRNYLSRELLREMLRQNHVLIAFINGMGPAPSYDRTIIDGLLDKAAAVIEQVDVRPKTKKQHLAGPESIGNSSAGSADRRKEGQPDTLLNGKQMRHQVASL